MDGRNRPSYSSALRVALSAAAVFALASCREAPRTELLVGRDVRTAVLESVSSSGVHRWEKKSVTVSWVGEESSTDRAVLENTAEWVTSATGVLVEVITSEKSGSDADITVHNIPKSEWSQVLHSESTHEDADGVAQARWGNNGALQSVVVVLNSQAPQSSRNRTIAHEMLHAMGMGHHSCQGGLAYGGADLNPVWEPTAFDVQVLQTTYSQNLRTGESAESAGEWLVEDGNANGCPEMLYETIRSADDGVDVWCRVGEEPLECSEADVSRGPGEDLEVVRWFKEGVLYEYDPLRYVAFSLDGERVLCEIPGGVSRSRCQKTSGREVTSPDLYTDGKELFEEPTD